ncbi:uncharacterized protein LOC144165074 [Haemaphysalis longicornis]
MNTGRASGEGSAATGDGARGSGGSLDIPPLPGLPPLGEGHVVVETAVRLLQMRIESTARSMADVRRDTEEMRARTSFLRRENARLHDAIAEERASFRQAENALRARDAPDWAAAGGTGGRPGAASTSGHGAGGASASPSAAGPPVERACPAGASAPPPAEEAEHEGPLNIMDFLEAGPSD